MIDYSRATSHTPTRPKRSPIWKLVTVSLCLACLAPAQVLGEPTVGAYYYPWWGESVPGGHSFNQTLRGRLRPERQLPAVGRYSSRDSNVISAHIDQSHRGNVSMWSLSWWGPDSFEDATIRNHILPHPRAGELEYTIHYESSGRLGEFGSPVYSNLVPDFEHLARHVFSDPNYLHIDGRPVVVLYLSRVYFAKPAGWKALSTLREVMRERYGYDPYLIGDHVFRHVAPGADRLDAITAFDVYGQALGDGVSDKAGVDKLARIYAAAQASANEAGVDFAPGVSPGYNDRAVRGGHPPAARYLEERGPNSPGSVWQAILTNAALPHTDPDLGHLILVNSFNEWHEDTQIEASIEAPRTNKDDSQGSSLTERQFYEGYGTHYLDALRAATLGEDSSQWADRAESADAERDGRTPIRPDEK